MFNIWHQSRRPYRLPRVKLALLGTMVSGLAWWCCAGCSSKIEEEPVVPEISRAMPRQGSESARTPEVRFTDISTLAGISFRHMSGAFGKKLLPETMGSGVAFLDFDNDGKQDILFVNSCYWPGHEKGQSAPMLALYHNKGDGTFEDVTVKAGLAVTMYGMGVVAGDYDNDGWIDLFITGLGGNRLFRNVSDGANGRRFVDVTQKANVAGPGGWPKSFHGDFLGLQTPINFSTSAAFLDYDGDGLLDLFVCNYVTWSPENDIRQPFQLVGIGRAYGPPTAFEGANCLLYRNRGDGTFEEVSGKTGIHVKGSLGQPIGKSLGVVTCDVDRDGWPDVMVANDTVRNFFFHNKGDGTFEEIGERAGIAYAEGSARGAMGTDGGEYRPGRFAYLIGNFANEPDTFLRLDDAKQFWFSDAALAEGIAGPSRTPLKFGTFFFDYDLDGRLDLLTCNGHLEPEIGQVQQGQTYPQSVQLFWNTGGKRCFEQVTALEAGNDLFRPMVGRGCAYGDINGDGYPDIVLTENGGPARLLKNEGGPNHWIRLVLKGNGKTSNRSAIGARVICRAGGIVQQREVLSARGYLSQSELPITFGLGKNTKVDEVVIHWPGKKATEQVIKGLRTDRVHIIDQPEGK